MPFAVSPYAVAFATITQHTQPGTLCYPVSKCVRPVWHKPNQPEYIYPNDTRNSINYIRHLVLCCLWMCARCVWDIRYTSFGVLDSLNRIEGEMWRIEGGSNSIQPKTRLIMCKCFSCVRIMWLSSSACGHSACWISMTAISRTLACDACQMPAECMP